jgi:hypothetical protein
LVINLRYIDFPTSKFCLKYCYHIAYMWQIWMFYIHTCIESTSITFTLLYPLHLLSPPPSGGLFLNMIFSQSFPSLSVPCSVETLPW